MQLLTIEQRRKRGVTALAFAPDGRALAACSSLAAPVLWELPAGVPIVLSPPPAYSAHALTFSRDGHVVSWLTSQGRFERDRRTPDARPVRLVPDAETPVMQVTCGPGGRLIVRTVERNVGHRYRAFEPDPKGGWIPAWTLGPADDMGGRLMAGAARADRFFAWEVPPVAPGRRRRFVVRSALTGKIVEEVPTGLIYTGGFAAAPDGSRLVYFKDSSLYAWRPDGKVEKVRTGTLKHYRALAFHPDGRHLLAGNNDTTARLLDTHTWQITRQFAWDIGVLAAVAVSPDGTLAAAGGAKGRVVVWDLDL